VETACGKCSSNPSYLEEINATEVGGRETEQLGTAADVILKAKVSESALERVRPDGSVTNDAGPMKIIRECFGYGSTKRKPGDFKPMRQIRDDNENVILINGAAKRVMGTVTDEQVGAATVAAESVAVKPQPVTAAPATAVLVTAVKVTAVQGTAVKPTTVPVTVSTCPSATVTTVPVTVCTCPSATVTDSSVMPQIDTRLTRLPKALLPKPFQKISYKPVRPAYYVVSKTNSVTNTTEVSSTPAPGISEKLTAGISEKLTAGISEKHTPGISEKLTAGISEKLHVTAGISEELTAAISEKLTAAISKKLTAGISKNLTAGISEILTVSEEFHAATRTLDIGLKIASDIATLREARGHTAAHRATIKNNENKQTNKNALVVEPSHRQNGTILVERDFTENSVNCETTTGQLGIETTTSDVIADKVGVSKQLEKCEHSKEDNLEVCSVESLRSRMNAILEKIRQSERSRFSKSTAIAQRDYRMRSSTSELLQKHIQSKELSGHDRRPPVYSNGSSATGEVHLGISCMRSSAIDLKL